MVTQAVLSALEARVGPLTPHGRKGSHLRFRRETSSGRSWEVRVPSEPELTEFFKAELELVAALQHQHVIPLVTSGEVGGVPFYAVEVGQDLFERMNGDRMPPDAVVGLLQDLASGVARCHEHDVVLGDLGPLGVCCYSDRYVLDSFGDAAARTVRRDRESVAIGNPTYMSPERCWAGAVDERSDIYGLGAIAYLCLAGSPAHGGSSAQEIITRKSQAPQSLPRPVRREAPALAALTERMLAPDPAHRVQSARELAQLLAGMGSRT